MADDVDQEFVGVVPGVARRVMGRSRETPVGPPLAPVRLAFEPDPMASRAVLAVYHLPARHLLGIARIDRRAARCTAGQRKQRAAQCALP